MRETLIKITRQESNERRMDPRIGIEAIDHLQPVAMPHRSGSRRYRRLVCAAHGFEARVPQTAHRPALFPHGIVFLPVLDIFCTNAIEEDEHLGDKVRRAGKEFWQYGGGTSDAAGHPDQARSLFGFFFNAYDSRGHLVWAYNWGARFDTTHRPNWLMAWQTPFDIIRTPFYEGIREGLDDRRYVETLKRLAHARGVDITAFLAALDTEAKQLGAPGSQRADGDFWRRARTSRQFDQLRQRVIEKILALR